jgi:hypothetical protein
MSITYAQINISGVLKILGAVREGRSSLSAKQRLAEARDEGSYGHATFSLLLIPHLG